jgi:esterase/lipase superfamily enzyme
MVVHTVVGHLKIVKIRDEDFLVQKNRKIRIWTPDSYDKDASRPYNVIYMFDGQNLFDDATSFSGEWHIDEAIDGIEYEDHLRPSIVVGLDNSADRMSEYLPKFSRYAISEYAYKAGTTFLFLVNQVIPYIEANYNVGKTRAFRSIGGSSMGGLMALAGGIYYPKVFSRIYAFSNAFAIFKFGKNENTPIDGGVGNDSAFDFVIRQYCAPQMINRFKIALTSGGTGIEANYYDYVTMMHDRLIRGGWKESNIAVFQDRSLEHNEYQWSRFFPEAYRFMNKKNRS